jgi:hypothetical protein
MAASNKLFRLVDLNVRAGESPSDMVVVECKGTLSGGTLSCTTPFKSGKDVAHLVMYRGTTNSSGVLTADISKPGNTDNCTVLVFGKGYDLQAEFS